MNTCETCKNNVICERYDKLSLAAERTAFLRKKPDEYISVRDKLCVVLSAAVGAVCAQYEASE